MPRSAVAIRRQQCEALIEVSLNSSTDIECSRGAASSIANGHPVESRADRCDRRSVLRRQSKSERTSFRALDE